MTGKRKPGAKPGNSNALKSAEPLACNVQIRCTPMEKEIWVHTANGELSNWVRKTLNAAAKEALSGSD